MLRIGIIEDNTDYREAFRNYFSKSSQEAECLFAVESIEKFKKYYSSILSLDILLVDIHLGKIDGIQGVRQIRKINPNLEIIMLTAFDDTKLIFQALTAGANGYLLKNLSFSEIEKELLYTIENGAAMSPQIARRIVKYFNPDTKPLFFKGNKKLSEKESQIVKLVIDGKTYEEIAPFIGLTINGLKYHIKNIYKKLQVKSKSEIIKQFFNQK